MKLKKVHSVLAFNQKDWMKPYIRLNTELRKKATSDFEKNFFKLMNNSVFGKTMENLKNRTVVKLVRANEGEKLQKLTSHPLYARSAVFGESLAGIQMHKDHILMNRPVYTGMCVLDLSKTLMYEFYYRHLDYKYDSKCQLLYTDTDSPPPQNQDRGCLQRHAKKSLFHYDTSDFPKDHPLHRWTDVVCLRSKMYSILLESEKNIKKAKGTTNSLSGCSISLRV